MKSEEEIAAKCKQLYEKILLERKQKFLAKNHLNCKFNVRHRVKQNGMVGFCTNESVTGETRRSFFVCNDEQVASCCQQYECLYTEEMVEKEFAELVADPARCGKEYPKLAVLIWVLHGKTYG